MKTLTQIESSVRGAGRSVLVGSLGAFGAGSVIAVLCALARSPNASPAPPGVPRVWVADRDAQRVYALDSDLLLALRIPVNWPLEIESTLDGGTWVLRNDTAQAGTSQRLDRFDAHGMLITELYLTPCRDLDVLEGDQALVLERIDASNVRLSRVRTEGSVFPLLTLPDLSCVCGSRNSVVVGTSGGAVMRVDPTSGAILAHAQIGGAIGDVVAGPDGGGVWALDVAGARRLFLLDAALGVRWVTSVGFAAQHVAPVPNAERAWVCDTQSTRVVRYGPGGVVELDRQDLPLGGLDRAIAWDQGGALLVAPGALLHVDALGHSLPGQGGFAWIADVAAVR